jgi:predicted nucleic acid-binding protein
LKAALDAWAVVALLDGTEPAASRVQEVLDQQRPIMSWINAGEVYYILRRNESEAEATVVVRELRNVAALELPSDRRVLEAAALKTQHPMSYADAFAAATAIANEATLLTGDPELLAPDAPWRCEDLRA